MDQALRQNATLRQVAAVRPEATAAKAAEPMRRTLAEEWAELVLALDAALREMRPDGDWPARLEHICQRARTRLQRRPDASLYLLVYQAGHETDPVFMDANVRRIMANAVRWASPAK